LRLCDTGSSESSIEDGADIVSELPALAADFSEGSAHAATYSRVLASPLTDSTTVDKLVALVALHCAYIIH